MSAHTPGPWSARVHAGQFFIENESEDVVAVAVPSFNVAGDRISADQARANARLIAAAPDLLESLRGLGGEYPDGQTCFCQLRVGNPMVSVHSTKCTRARAAIAKAEGQP